MNSKSPQPFLLWPKSYCRRWSLQWEGKGGDDLLVQGQGEPASVLGLGRAGEMGKSNIFTFLPLLHKHVQGKYLPGVVDALTNRNTFNSPRLLWQRAEEHGVMPHNTDLAMKWLYECPVVAVTDQCVSNTGLKQHPCVFSLFLLRKCIQSPRALPFLSTFKGSRGYRGMS